MLNYRKNEWTNPKKNSGRRDGGTEGRNDRQNLILKTFPAMVKGWKKNFHTRAIEEIPFALHLNNQGNSSYKQSKQ